MAFCSKCGNKLKPEDRFCPKCGTPVLPTEKNSDNNSDDIYKTQLQQNKQVYGVVNLEQLPAGHIIDDRYEVIEKIGQGGFGAVYRVYDKNMNIEKALKIIPEAMTQDKEAMFDIQKESQTMIKLNHPNIVRVYDFHQSGVIKYIDMEFVDGKTLTEIKLEHRNKQIPENIVKNYALQIAQGLAFSHSNSVIHRDLKPANVMINKDNKVKIMDFGIAETVRTSMSRLENSTSSGTLVYMSPEQIKGKNVGKEADIYAFGAMIYELLSGHPPFYKGDINYQILNEKPSKLENVSDKMNELIFKCLEKNYKDRYRDFEEIVKQLGGKFVNGTFKQSVIQPINNTNSSKFIKTLTSVSIQTNPDGATIYFDDNKKGFETPFKNDLTVGTHVIKIEKTGYVSIEDKIVISENSSNKFFLELESAMGSITIETEISGLSIWLKGKKTGTKTPHTFKNIIPETNYKFQIKDEKYLSKPVIVSISNNESKKYLIKNLNIIPADMAWVEDGTFQMGSNDGENNEKPIHRVTVNDFYIGKYPVTQKEWKEIMGTSTSLSNPSNESLSNPRRNSNSNPSNNPNSNPSFFKGENVIKEGFLGIGRIVEKYDLSNNPVESISWYDAVKYCNLRSEKEGLTPCYAIDKTRKDSNNKSDYDDKKWIVKCDFSANGYRLPTEAEWEYAARGGSSGSPTKYAGSNNIDEVVWYGKNSGNKTHAVGGKKPNELGIYDMSGNVYEWCWDWYGSDYYGKSPKNNPQGPNSGVYSVLRGGSWDSNDYGCRVAHRYGLNRGNVDYYHGFRLVRTP